MLYNIINIINKETLFVRSDLPLMKVNQSDITSGSIKLHPTLRDPGPYTFQINGHENYLTLVISGE